MDTKRETNSVMIFPGFVLLRRSSRAIVNRESKSAFTHMRVVHTGLATFDSAPAFVRRLHAVRSHPKQESHMTIRIRSFPIAAALMHLSATFIVSHAGAADSPQYFVHTAKDGDTLI